MSESTPPPPARHLTEEGKAAVLAAYQSLQKNLPGFRTRKAQARMIAAASRALGSSGGIGVVEAPTGVGKSLAYLTAGVPLALLSKRKLVVSTGTIALQAQLVERDIPAFLKATGIVAKVALAKGRQRYACTRNLAELAGEAAQADLGLGDDAALFSRPPMAMEVDAARRLMRLLEDRTWSGDIDAAPEAITNELRGMVTTTAGGCAGRRCSYATRCPALAARQNIKDADIVVANHDLVLADLAIGGGENGDQNIIADAKGMLLVLDEGHHLGPKAIDSGAFHVHLASALRRIGRLAPLLAAVYRTVPKDEIGRKSLHTVLADVQLLGKHLGTFRTMLEDSWQPEIPAPNSRAAQHQGAAHEATWRAPLGRLPDAWRLEANELLVIARELLKWLGAARRQVAEAKDASPAARDKLARDLGMAGELLQAHEGLWNAWSRDEDKGIPVARWMSMSNDMEILCHASPVTGANTLRQLLWGHVESILVTSATLSSGRDFNAMQVANGIPDAAEYLSLDSPFDLAAQATLEVPAFPVMPDDKERHPPALAAWLETRLDWGKGSLVLFTSRRKMEQVAALIPAALRPRLRVQGDKGKQALVDDHCAAVTRGEGSVLFGLASYGEGLDLAGDFCTTVVVTQIPFAVPSDPVGATLAEWIESRGGNPFLMISVPDALRMLTQYCGRLIRSETDIGRIVLLDRRVVTKFYGKQLLSSLPPFTQKIVR